MGYANDEIMHEYDYLGDYNLINGSTPSGAVGKNMGLLSEEIAALSDIRDIFAIPIAKNIGLNGSKNIAKSITDLKNVAQQYTNEILSVKRNEFLQIEYRTLMASLLALKEKHPDIKIDLDVSDKLINISDEMKEMLAYCFTEVGDSFFKFFESECQGLEGCEPEKWFYYYTPKAIYCTSDKLIAFRYNNAAFAFSKSGFKDDYELLFNKARFRRLRYEECHELVDNYSRLVKSNHIAFSKGFYLLNSWIENRNLQITISYLREAYSYAVMQVLNT